MAVVELACGVAIADQGEPVTVEGVFSALLEAPLHRPGFRIADHTSGWSCTVRRSSRPRTRCATTSPTSRGSAGTRSPSLSTRSRSVRRAAGRSRRASGSRSTAPRARSTTSGRRSTRAPSSTSRSRGRCGPRARPSGSPGCGATRVSGSPPCPPTPISPRSTTRSVLPFPIPGNGSTHRNRSRPVRTDRPPFLWIGYEMSGPAPLSSAIAEWDAGAMTRVFL